MTALTLPPDRRNRLLSALYETGAVDAGERAAAGLELSVALRSVGLKWDQLLIGGDPAPEAPPPAPASDWRADWTLCRNRLGFLQPWEKAFVASLAGVAVPTRKQGVVLAEIATGLRRRGLG